MVWACGLREVALQEIVIGGHLQAAILGRRLLTFLAARHPRTHTARIGRRVRGENSASSSDRACPTARFEN